MYMIFKRLEWDEYNIAHISRHNVIPVEFEEVMQSDVVRLKSKSHPTRIVLIGKTKAGRLLKIVLEPLKQTGEWRPVTAHDASKKERRLYQEERGGEQAA
jgi:uncharacterized DUF497 family protein